MNMVLYLSGHIKFLSGPVWYIYPYPPVLLHNHMIAPSAQDAILKEMGENDTYKIFLWYQGFPTLACIWTSMWLAPSYIAWVNGMPTTEVTPVTIC